MDYYPTVLELLGLPARPKQHQDGKSLASVLRGQSKLDRDAVFWHYPHYHGSAWAPGAALRAGEWKLIEFYGQPPISPRRCPLRRAVYETSFSPGSRA
jgi:arylsulfatase A-like enzyme